MLLFHENKMLIKPKQYPRNKLPESPIYNFAFGKLKYKKPNIDATKTIDISVSLY